MTAVFFSLFSSTGIYTKTIGYSINVSINTRSSEGDLRELCIRTEATAVEWWLCAADIFMGDDAIRKRLHLAALEHPTCSECPRCQEDSQQLWFLCSMRSATARDSIRTCFLAGLSKSTSSIWMRTGVKALKRPISNWWVTLANLSCNLCNWLQVKFLDCISRKEDSWLTEW